MERQLHGHASGVEHDDGPHEIAELQPRSTASIGGVDLEYAVVDGDRCQPTLVFLHEGLGSISSWRDFPSNVCARTNSPGLIYSRYGNGFSTVLDRARRPEYMHEEALQTLPSLLDALRIRSTMLIGHSDGASIALLYAAEFPRDVAGLILEAPHVFVEETSVRSITAIRSQYEDGPLRERLGRHHSSADATFYGWNDIWLSPEFAGWNIEAAVDRIRAPMLLLQGRDDEYGTLGQIDAIVRHHRSVDSLILANCGHTPHRDRAAFVEATIADWIVERRSRPDR
jgi:pimeloyl-ACP methyl ester carboxylesterase